MKNYVSLDHVLMNATGNKRHMVILEHRPKKYLFGTLNYGEITGWYNSADGDCWDVFVPGMKRRLPLKTPMKVKEILGVLFLENGNHKLAVQVYYPNFDNDAAEQEITQYSKIYTQKMNKLGFWMDLETIKNARMTTKQICDVFFNRK